jgi:hypothetical protein
MDKEPLVEMYVEDGLRVIEALVAEGIEVKAAAWIRKDVEYSWWHLYIATPLVDKEGRLREAYRRINPVLREISPPLRVVDQRVRLIAPDDPVALAVQEIHRRYPGSGSFQYTGASFGGMSVDGVYIYPPVAAPVG